MSDTWCPDCPDQSIHADPDCKTCGGRGVVPVCSTCGGTDPAKSWLRIRWSPFVLMARFTDEEVGKWADIVTEPYDHFRCPDPFHGLEDVDPPRPAEPMEESPTSARSASELAREEKMKVIAEQRQHHYERTVMLEQSLGQCRRNVERLEAALQASEAEREKLLESMAVEHEMYGDPELLLRRAEDAESALRKIRGLKAKWEAPVVCDDARASDRAWAPVGSEAHKIAEDALKDLEASPGPDRTR